MNTIVTLKNSYEVEFPGRADVKHDGYFVELKFRDREVRYAIDWIVSIIEVPDVKAKA